MKTKILLALLIFTIAITVYSNAAGGQFFSDDSSFVIMNRAIQSLDNIPGFFTNPKTVGAGEFWKEIYRPLTPLSYAIDYYFWKLDPFGYHITNILLHAANSVLVFVFFSLIFGDALLAALAALFFAVHPVQTEAVSWIAGRSNVLSLFFYLASLIFYVRYSSSGKGKWYLASIAACGAALFSKEMSATLVLMIAAYDMHFGKKERPTAKLARYSPYILLTVLYLAVRTLLVGQVGQTGWWGGHPYNTLITMAIAFAGYIKLLVFPIKLFTVGHTIPVAYSILDPRVLFSLGAILIIAVIAMPAAFKRSRQASFGLWWLFIGLLPVSNIIPIKALLAERFLYLPSIGFCLLLAILVKKIGGELAFRGKGSFRAYIAAVLALILIGGYSVRTVMRNEDWNAGLTLSAKMLDMEPHNAWALSSYGASLMAEGKFEEAIIPLKKAAQVSKDYALPRASLGTCYIALKRYEEAVPALLEAVTLEPKNAGIWNSLAIAYGELKKYDESEKALREAIKIDPKEAQSYFNLAKLFELKKDYVSAIKACHDLISVTKDNDVICEAYMWIGDDYEEMKDKKNEKEAYQKALEHCPASMSQFREKLERKIKELSK